MGCPCKRVTGGLAGAALDARSGSSPQNWFAAAVRAIVRSGERQNAARMGSTPRATPPELARRAETEGAAHGRPCMGARGSSFITAPPIGRRSPTSSEAVRIPVVANGDCDSPEDAQGNAAAFRRGRRHDRPRGARASLACRRYRSFSVDGQTPRAVQRYEARRDIALEHFDALLIGWARAPDFAMLENISPPMSITPVARATEEGASLRRSLVVSDSRAKTCANWSNACSRASCEMEAA